MISVCLESNTVTTTLLLARNEIGGKLSPTALTLRSAYECGLRISPFQSVPKAFVSAVVSLSVILKRCSRAAPAAAACQGWPA